MRVFVTGGTGFVGSHVLHALVRGGHEVRALRRGAAPADAPREVQWVPGDVLDARALAAGIAGCEAVIHAAAMISARPAERARQHEVNVDGTRNIVAAAIEAGVRRFVNTSSVAAIGRAERGHVADEHTRYNWPPGFGYQESKRDSERVALAAAQRGLEVVSLNPALVLGPGEPHGRTLRLLRMVKRGIALVAPPGGLSICDVRDVAEAHVTALTRGHSGERYILAGPTLSFRELLSLYADALGAVRPRVTLPEAVVRAGALVLSGAGRLLPLPVSGALLVEILLDRSYTSAKAIRELAYHERPAAETIGDAVAWYRERGQI